MIMKTIIEREQFNNTNDSLFVYLNDGQGNKIIKY